MPIFFLLQTPTLPPLVKRENMNFFNRKKSLKKIFFQKRVKTSQNDQRSIQRTLPHKIRDIGENHGARVV